MAAPKLPGGSGDDEADSASAAAAEERDAAVDDRGCGEARASLDRARRVPRSDARASAGTNDAIDRRRRVRVAPLAEPRAPASVDGSEDRPVLSVLLRTPCPRHETRRKNTWRALTLGSSYLARHPTTSPRATTRLSPREGITHVPHVARLHAGGRRGPGVLVARASVPPARRPLPPGASRRIRRWLCRGGGRRRRPVQRGRPAPNRLDEQAARDRVYRLASETSGGRGAMEAIQGCLSSMPGITNHRLMLFRHPSLKCPLDTVALNLVEPRWVVAFDAIANAPKRPGDPPLLRNNAPRAGSREDSAGGRRGAAQTRRRRFGVPGGRRLSR